MTIFFLLIRLLIVAFGTYQIVDVFSDKTPILDKSIECMRIFAITALFIFCTYILQYAG